MMLGKPNEEHPLYSVWIGMKQRCYSRNYDGYSYYGGRGIKVCARWLTFANFVADVGERPAGTSLDRIDNDGNYEPSNCRWATPQQQSANRRRYRSSSVLEWRGESRSLSEWSAALGLSRRGVAGRLKMGWTVEQALTTPPRRITHTNVRFRVRVLP